MLLMFLKDAPFERTGYRTQMRWMAVVFINA